ncbi:MAG: hypothetical protein NXI32_11515 [bacterium]|nr:hypothetical protein [bacterium]
MWSPAVVFVGGTVELHYVDAWDMGKNLETGGLLAKIWEKIRQFLLIAMKRLAA